MKQACNIYVNIKHFGNVVHEASGYLRPSALIHANKLQSSFKHADVKSITYQSTVYVSAVDSSLYNVYTVTNNTDNQRQYVHLLLAGIITVNMFIYFWQG